MNWAISSIGPSLIFVASQRRFAGRGLTQINGICAGRRQVVAARQSRPFREIVRDGLLERSIGTQHDADIPRPIWRARKSCEETPMLERALPFKPEITAGQRLALHKPAETIAGLRDFRDRLLRLLRFLGEFIARGGPLS
jgi:hypothetical protein